MENQQNKFNNRLDLLEKKVKEIEKELDQLAKHAQPVRSTQADLWETLKSQRIKLATLKGKQEQIQHTIGDLKKNTTNSTQIIKSLQNKTQSIKTDLEKIISQLGIEIEETKKTPSSPPKDSPNKKQEQTPSLLYDKALNAFQKRNYQSAQTLWSEFAQNFPEHDLVPNAIFWQGECLYQMEDFSRAIQKYQTVIEKHSKSNKYPSALLKQGLSFYKLGKNKAGRIRLEELIDKFPNKAESRRAKMFLQKEQ